MGNILDNQSEEKHVLKKSLGGGPRGLGDPDDRSLRRVESDILVSKLVREKVRNEKCKEIGDALDKCGGEAKLLVGFKCRKERDELMECSKYWFHNEELRKECTEEYLRRRSHYRRTGEKGEMHRFAGVLNQEASVL